MCNSMNHTRLPKKFSYQTEQVGTNKVQRVIVYTFHGYFTHLTPLQLILAIYRK